MPLKLEAVVARASAKLPTETGTVLNLETLVREVIAACGLEVSPKGEVYNPAPPPPMHETMRGRGARWYGGRRGR